MVRPCPDQRLYHQAWWLLLQVWLLAWALMAVSDWRFSCMHKGRFMGESACLHCIALHVQAMLTSITIRKYDMSAKAGW